MSADLESRPEAARWTERFGPSAHSRFAENDLTDRIIGAAIEVHRNLGPGLLESAYELCLCYELNEAGLQFERQVELPIVYKGIRLDCGYRMDLVVEDTVVVELKSIEELLPIHSAQLLTYLKSSGRQVGLLINFNVTVLKYGLKRMVNHYTGPAPGTESPGVASPAAGLSGWAEQFTAETQRRGEIAEKT
jgi:GxxExxY protein